MPQPKLEPEEIIEKFDLPSYEDIIDALGTSQAILDKEIASSQDYHKQGNNPPSYLSVRSVSELIEDEYDSFVETQYRNGNMVLTRDELLNAFKQQLNAHLTDCVIVKNTGRAYLPDDQDQTTLEV